MSVPSMRFSTTVSARLPIFAAYMTSVNRFPRAAVSFILLAAALFLFSASAFAEFCPDSRFVAVQDAASGVLDLAAGSAIDGALGALGVKLGLGTGALLTTLDLIQSVISGTPLGVVDYQYKGSFYDLADQSTIRIRDDVVTIDGVDYKDVWLPHDAAAKFRVNAFDFISFYNIVSESNGVYASGSGTFDGCPYYQVGSQFITPTYTFGSSGIFQMGDFRVYNGNTNAQILYPGQTFGFACTTSTGVKHGGGYSDVYISSGHLAAASSSAGFPTSFSFEFTRSNGTTSFFNYGTDSASLISTEPFDFAWTSSVIPAEELPATYGLRFRIPATYVAGIPSTLDPSLPDYSSYLQSLSDAIEQARLADAVESTAFEEVDTPVPPVPSTGTIAEEPYASLDGSLNGIQDSLNNIDTNIGTVDESLDDIQVYAEDAADSLQSIDTNLSQSVADTAGIKGFIQQYLPGVHSLLNSISTSVSNIAGSVAAADETFFGNVVDAIVAPFTPVFDIFKSGVGIWRYVVAWVGNISAPFSWIWSTLSQANGILVSPILASAAAAVVLAVYKRFGR